mmetsp:Transcript_38544/g.50521  ORF Transcript_38544/g.50521 Transcript_38544/m.50521 type:complete len:171 (-) Transcript_38544:3298-3810(-)
MSFRPFEAIKTLVPQNCLVNKQDVIPGLETEFCRFPVPRPSFSAPYMTQAIKAKIKKPVYLHNLTLMSSAEFERQFESFLREVVSIENGDLGNSITNVIISKRSIHVGVSNSWHNLNKMERQIVLDEPNRQGVCSGTGSVELSDYVEDPLVALTFRIEFNATLPVKPVPR